MEHTKAVPVTFDESCLDCWVLPQGPALVHGMGNQST